MTIKYTYDFGAPEVTLLKIVDGKEYVDAVNVIHWRINATDSVASKDPKTGEMVYQSATRFGTVAMNNDDITPEKYIAFSDLTEDKLVEWADELMDVPFDQLKKDMAAQIALAKNPVVMAKPLIVAA